MSVLSFAIATFALLAMALSAPPSGRKYWSLVALAALAIDAVRSTTATEPWVLLVGVMIGSNAYVTTVATVLSIVRRNKRVRRYVGRNSTAIDTSKEVRND